MVLGTGNIECEGEGVVEQAEFCYTSKEYQLPAKRIHLQAMHDVMMSNIDWYVGSVGYKNRASCTGSLRVPLANDFADMRKCSEILSDRYPHG